jgi:hypothetical protein
LNLKNALTGALWWNINKRFYLVEFRVEKSQESQDGDAKDDKSAESEIAHKKQRRPGRNMVGGIYIKKPDSPGGKKYQSQYQEKYLHKYPANYCL